MRSVEKIPQLRELIPYWNGDGVNTGLKPTDQARRNDHKTTTLGIAIGTAIAALGLAITAVPEAKAGGVYWNNNGGGGVVINRCTTYGPRGYYNYGPNYYGGRGVVAGPNGACARGYYGRGGCVRY